jgi:hypothetical protein
MRQWLIGIALFAWMGAATSYAHDLQAIIGTVAENCGKIVTYTADAAVRYHI